MIKAAAPRLLDPVKRLTKKNCSTGSSSILPTSTRAQAHSESECMAPVSTTAGKGKGR